MSRVGKLRLLGALIVAGIVFLVRGVTARNRQPDIATRRGFLLSAFAFVCLTLQSGLLWSDSGHIVLATYAVAFLTGVVLFFLCLTHGFSRRRSGGGDVFVSVWQATGPSCTALRYNYQQLRNPSTTCPSRFVEFDRVCYPDEFAGTLQTTATFLQQHSGPREFMTVFPLQNIFGVAAPQEHDKKSLAIVPREWCLFVASERRWAEPGGSSSWTLPS